MTTRFVRRRMIAAGAVLALAFTAGSAALLFAGDNAPAKDASAASEKAANAAAPKTAWPLSKPAPLFDLQDMDGKAVKLAELKGKVVLVDFWATWCGPCRKGIPHLISLYDTYKTEGLVVVGISVDKKGKGVVAEFTKANKINYPVVIADPKTPEAYGGIYSIPTAFLIDQQGNIRKKYIGYQPKEVFEKDVQLLLSGA